MVIDIELTLNRFGFGKIAENKCNCPEDCK